MDAPAHPGWGAVAEAIDKRVTNDLFKETMMAEQRYVQSEAQAAKATVGDAVAPWPEFSMEDAKGALNLVRGDFSAHNVRHGYNLVGFGLSFPFPLGNEPRPPVGAAKAEAVAELSKEQTEQYLERSIALRAGPGGVAVSEMAAFPWASIAMFILKLLIDRFTTA